MFRIFYAFSLWLIGSSAFACDCIGGSFLESSAHAPLVVHAKVIAHSPTNSNGFSTSMNLAVIGTLKGSANPGPLHVLGDRGADCRPYVSWFPVGSEWVFALSPYVPGDNSNQEEPSWVISICGEHWLSVKGETVVGALRIHNKQETISLEDLYRLLAKPLTRHSRGTR